MGASTPNTDNSRPGPPTTLGSALD
jgi:hypothetical protein